jgi:hypothetical protein
VVGGIRFSQVRSIERSCSYRRLRQFYGDCQPYHTHDQKTFGYPQCEASTANSTTTGGDDYDDHNGGATAAEGNVTLCFHPEAYDGFVDLYHDEAFSLKEDTNTFELWIDLFDDEKTIHKRVSYLKDRHWIDKQTKKVKIEFLVYNGQEDPLISKVDLNFHFTRGEKEREKRGVGV